MTIAGRRFAGLALLATLSLPLVGRGDGCLMKMGGDYVSETHQQAFIEWIGNRERLHLATRSQAHDGPVLWMVPVPGDPTQVDAEPMETIPVIADDYEIVKAAQSVCWDTLNATFLLDSGFLIPFVAVRTLGMRASGTFSAVGAALPSGSSGVTVYQHVEKLGMVVEVLTAQSSAALDRYLTRQGVDVRAEQIVAIAPYLAKQFTLVCGWTTGKSVEARSMRIDFPTPRLYYPLLPTRVYQDEIYTQINVRGFVQPTGDTSKMGVRCSYVSGRKLDRSLAWLTPVEKWNADSAFIVHSSTLRQIAPEGFTQVKVRSRPSTWTSDLYFEPGAPSAVWAANWIQGNGVLFWFLISFGTGVVTAGFLPFVVARAEPANGDGPQPAPSTAPTRLRRDDFLWAAMVGGMIVGSIFLAGVTYCCWLYDRKHVGRGFSPVARKAALSIAIGMVALLALLIFVPSSRFDLLCILTFLGLTGVFFFSCFDVALRFARGKLLWLMLFALAHFGAVAIICTSLATWLAYY